jgi:hypothetical protein
LKLVAFALVMAGCAHAPPPPPPPAAPPPPAPAPVAAEPADELKVSGTLGTLSDDEIEGPFRRRWDDITACYREAVSRVRYLNGKVEVKVHVGPTGAPKRVYISASTIGSWSAERCILEVARTLTFSRPHGGSEAEFVYPLEFGGGGRVQAVRASEAPRGVPSEVAFCRARAPRGQPEVVTVTAYVGPGGKVASAGLAADAPLDDGFASCMVERVGRVRFEDPLGKIAKISITVGN